MMRKLGSRQAGMLWSLKEHRGFWHPGSGWTWTTVSETVSILKSLARRGFVEVEPYGVDMKCYRITRKGRKALRESGYPKGYL